jgi:hypothetical protein
MDDLRPRKILNLQLFDLSWSERWVKELILMRDLAADKIAEGQKMLRLIRYE